ncbi:MAG TPA: metal-sulfur cluster assembly factor [bacterium]|nr:metal-sulfur cluster assembly factor [bacterium]
MNTRAADTNGLWDALRDVSDPELPVNIVDMGLVYDVRLDGRTALVTVTFTAMGCPCIEWIKEDVRARLLREPNIDRVDVQVVWDPPWTAARLSEAAKASLRRAGVSS